MANTDKDLIISPSIGSTTEDPRIDFKGASATVGPSTITVRAYPTNNGTLSFEGSSGQLFSIVNSLNSGSIFSVNDISGIPLIDVDANATVKIGVFGGNTGIGSTTPTSKLDVVGGVKVLGVVTATSFSGDVGYARTAGIATYTPNAGVATYAGTAGIATVAASATYSQTSGISTISGISTYSQTSGIATYSSTSGVSTYASTAGIATVAVGFGTTSSINTTGIITASKFVGDGSGLSGIVASGSGIEIRDSGSLVGTAATIDFGDYLDVNFGSGIATVTAIIPPSSGASDWVRTGAGIHTLGNVGVGTTNPASRLHLFNTTGVDLRLEGSTAQSNSITFLEGGISFFRILYDGGLSSPNNLFKIQTGISSSGIDNDAITIQQSGNVGVGTINPTEKLSVGGNIFINQTTLYGSVQASTASTVTTGIHSGISTSVYRSVEYTIQASQGSNYQAVKILTIHDGTNAYDTQYGNIYNTEVATFDVDISGGNVRLVATASSTSTTNYTVNFIATRI